MASDFNKPAVGDSYAALLPALVGALQDLARSLEPALTGTSTNLPMGTTRWNAANAYWERYNGTSWVSLPTAGTNLYAINVSGNAATATSATSSRAITNAGGWSISPTGSKLYFSFNGSNLGSLDSSGNFIAAGNITAYGSP